VDRKDVKITLNIMLNAESREAAYRAANIPKRVFERIEKLFQPISDYFYTGVGLHLQYVDSVIAERIMLRSIEEGEAVLPVHDSMICRVPYAYRLQEVMEEVAEEVVGKLPAVAKQYKQEDDDIGINLRMEDILPYIEFEQLKTK